MPYRVCKVFEVESGHMLSKHPGRCRFPHGHSRRIEIVLAADTLDANDMVCDFKALKLAVEGFVDQFDHAMAVNSADPSLESMSAAMGDRVVVFENTDPTTEVLARHIYDFMAKEIASGRSYSDPAGNAYVFPTGLRVERVRVGETSSSWAEYAPDPSS